MNCQATSHDWFRVSGCQQRRPHPAADSKSGLLQTAARHPRLYPEPAAATPAVRHH